MNWKQMTMAGAAALMMFQIACTREGQQTNRTDGSPADTQTGSRNEAPSNPDQSTQGTESQTAPTR